MASRFVLCLVLLAFFLAMLPAPQPLEWVTIPAGPFHYGVHPDNKPDPIEALPSATIDLPLYSILRTQVTNHQYAECVLASACTLPVRADINPHYYDARFANHPAVYITWDQAQEFCAWLGGRLPSEHEWEKAARGTDSRDFPWNGGTDDLALRARVALSMERGTAEAGSYLRGASPYGVLDMGGNVREWVLDQYDAERKVLRGASWFDPPVYALTYARLSHQPDSPGHNRGFRCVK